MTLVVMWFVNKVRDNNMFFIETIINEDGLRRQCVYSKLDLKW